MLKDITKDVSNGGKNSRAGTDTLHTEYFVMIVYFKDPIRILHNVSRTFYDRIGTG